MSPVIPASSAKARPILVCADDFGLSPGVSQGILSLASVGRLSGTSCIMTTPAIVTFAPRLGALADMIDIGIHLTLTGLAPLGPCPRLAPNGRLPSFGAFACGAIAHALPMDEIAAELNRQFDQFDALFGCPPAFVDGHHHVHLFPRIRDIVVEGLVNRFAGRLPALRACDDTASRILARGVAPVRALALSRIGRELRRRAECAGIPTNSGISGIYGFSDRVPYAALFERFVKALPPYSLIVCHPGKVDAELRAVDSLTVQREHELDFFLGDGFPEAMRRNGLFLGRFDGLTK